MKIGIIGAGNIGKAIAEGLTKSKLIANKDLFVSDKVKENLESLNSKYAEIQTTTSNTDVAKKSDVVFLAVKPWLVETVLNEIKINLNFTKQILISVAAGVSLEKLHAILNNPQSNGSLFRLIPNTAVAVGQGVCIVAHDNTEINQNIESVKTLLSKLGETIVVPESQLNALMSLSSCGIAYAFRYIRAAVEGAVELGIKPDTAQKVVAQTLIGAAELLKTNQSHPETEIDKVTTPGGITIKGLNEMEANGFSNAVIKGLKASLIP